MKDYDDPGPPFGPLFVNCPDCNRSVGYQHPGKEFNGSVVITCRKCGTRIRQWFYDGHGFDSPQEGDS